MFFTVISVIILLFAAIVTNHNMNKHMAKYKNK